MIWQISIREGMKAAEPRMKELQKLIENGENYLQYGKDTEPYTK